MKKIIVFIALFAAGYLLFRFFTSKPTQQVTYGHPKNSVSTVAPVSQSTALFVPYWTLQHSPSSQYDTYIYFGVVPNATGINTQENGYLHVQKYTENFSTTQSLLAVTVTDKALAQTILDSSETQQKIVTQAVALQKKYGFQGVLLDFEISGIGFTSLTDNVTHFITLFAQTVHVQKGIFATTLYGDVFYRARPYDAAKIAAVSDQVYVMAYDFHKAGGDPGPNFPYAESNADSYTFPIMVHDFLQVIPKEKLTFVFGLFGYDWPVTDRGDSITTAQPLSTTDIQKKFTDSCTFTACVLKRNASAEPAIAYTDAQQRKHIIWFEDTTSIAKKILYLHEQGIGAVGYWANGYF